jgi:DNA-binding NarL/FixJ family response regulator
VLLVSNQTLLCAALGAIIGNDPGLEIVGATQVAGAVEMARTRRVDLVITDMGAEEKTERAFLVELRRRHAHARLLVLLASSEADCVRAAPAIGADGYVSMEASSAELMLAVRAIGAGQRHLCQRASQLLQEVTFASPHAARRAEVRITPRQREVVNLVAAGLSNRRIALLMNRSVKTVEKHRSDLMHRLGLHNSAQVTRFALRSGIAGDREMA